MSGHGQFNFCQGHCSIYHGNYKSHCHFPKNKGQAENGNGNKEMVAVSADVQLFAVSRRGVFNTVVDALVADL